MLLMADWLLSVPVQISINYHNFRIPAIGMTAADAPIREAVMLLARGRGLEQDERREMESDSAVSEVKCYKTNIDSLVSSKVFTW
jgi:hypothetical protein